MSEIRAFNASKDEPVLRSWVNAVCTNHKIRHPRLIQDMKDWMSTRNRQVCRLLKLTQSREPTAPIGLQKYQMSRSTLRRFMQPAEQTEYRSQRQMLGLWVYLASVPEYGRLFPEALATETTVEKSTSAGLPLSPAEQLSFAMENFFRETDDITHFYKMARMRRRLPGRYVMYRLDLEPALRGMSPRHTVRTSSLQITESNGVLHIKETQDFPKTAGRDAHYQVNKGIIISYGDYMIALMNCEQRHSFKCMVLEQFVPVSERFGVTEFNGKLLVASYLASAPSAKFVCRRLRGKTKFGIKEYEVIDKDVLEILRTPTFSTKYQVIS